MIAFDFESCRFAPGLPAPPPVCLSTARDREASIIASDDAYSHMRRALARILASRETVIGFNVSYDLGLWLEWFPEHIDDIFEALDEGRFVDAGICERLREMACGEPARYRNLSELCEAYGLGTLDKGVQKDYGWLLGRPLHDYPEAHAIYPLKDAMAHLHCWKRVWARSKSKVSFEAVQAETRHSVWLHLVSCAGFRTNPDQIDKLRASAMRAVAELRSRVVEYGYLRGPDDKKPYSKNMAAIKAAVEDAYEGKPPLTKKKATATHKIALQDSGDPRLEDFSRYGEWSSVLNKDIDLLEAGTKWPVHTRFGLADGTRTTSSKPNTQNFRRLAGVRECIVPREGNCFVSIDVSGLEMGTQAQIHVWDLDDWRMADLINKGVDLHLFSACRLGGWEYALEKQDALKKIPEVKELRQFCKIANFGYPGFMAAKTLVPYARQQGTRITLKQAEDLKSNWGRTLPGCLRYLKKAKTYINRRTGKYDFIVPGTENIMRGGATLSACANGQFQGLGARAMKNCGWEILKEAWTVRSSPIYKIRVPFFIHDEFVAEVPIGYQDLVARRLDEIIVKSLSQTLPNVKMKTEYAASSVLSKDAKELRNRKGELLIWSP